MGVVGRLVFRNFFHVERLSAVVRCVVVNQSEFSTYVRSFAAAAPASSSRSGKDTKERKRKGKVSLVSCHLLVALSV